MATMRVRLTAYSLAALQGPQKARHDHRGLAYARATLAQAAADLAGFYERVAVLVGRPVARDVVLPISVPVFAGLDGNSDTTASSDVRKIDGISGTGGAKLVRVVTAPHDPHLLWVEEHLEHLSSHAQAITAPATHVAEQRRLPWWR